MGLSDVGTNYPDDHASTGTTSTIIFLSHVPRQYHWPVVVSINHQISLLNLYSSHALTLILLYPLFHFKQDKILSLKEFSVIDISMLTALIPVFYNFNSCVT